MDTVKLKFLYGSILNVYLILSYLTLLKADASENSATAVEVHQGATDGEQFVRRIVHGEKITDRPDYLVFTAPYRLCKGGCSDVKNFVLSFPLYVGKKARGVYQGTFKRDKWKINSMNPNAPFRKRITQTPMSTCQTFKETTTENITTTTENITTTTENTTPTTENTTTTTENTTTTTENTTPTTENSIMTTENTTTTTETTKTSHSELTTSTQAHFIFKR